MTMGFVVLAVQNCLYILHTLALDMRHDWVSDLSLPFCDCASYLVSKTLTMAPMFLAVPMADRPATPPPMTSTLAGGTRPAAVI